MTLTASLIMTTTCVANSISTGIFGYRKEAAAHVALQSVRSWLEQPLDETPLSNTHNDTKVIAQSTNSTPTATATESIPPTATPILPATTTSTGNLRKRRADAFDLVVFDTFTAEDTAIYQRLLPIYFPH
jgi:hypothetical protein